MIFLTLLCLTAIYMAFKKNTGRKRKILLFIGVTTIVLLSFIIGFSSGFAFILVYDDGFAGIAGAYLGWLASCIAGIIMILIGMFMKDKNRHI
ncbi:hypothetical protein [Bacillus sp. 1P06AnD]|uniref:hypothetical protein n=1 Tax=Bacillus sp. 1P06AnD TaxID=3132208 RepID=UPI0039A075F1